MKTQKVLTIFLILNALLTTSGSAIADLTTGLVAYYPFNGNANDASGNGNNGTVNGATLTTDRFGKANSAYSFNGAGNYILISDPVPSALQIQNEITLSAWLYASKYPNNNLGLIVGSQYDTNGAGATIFLDGRTNNDGQPSLPGHIHFQIGDSSWHTTNAKTQVPLNQWVHIVATRKANEDAKVYYNSVLQDLTSVAWSGSISYNRAWFAIGQQKDTNRPFNGFLDDIRVYNRALSNTEIQQLYQEGNPSQYLGVTTIPDVDSDGKADQALLTMKSGQYYLRIISSATGKQLKQISLGSNLTPIDLTTIDQQISILITKSNGASVLQLRDSVTGALVTTINLPK